jgi:hypothetical protein
MHDFERFLFGNCPAELSELNLDFSATVFAVSRALFAKVVACGVNVPHVSFDMFRLELAVNASF